MAKKKRKKRRIKSLKIKLPRVRKTRVKPLVLKSFGKKSKFTGRTRKQRRQNQKTTREERKIYNRQIKPKKVSPKRTGLDFGLDNTEGSYDILGNLDNFVTELTKDEVDEVDEIGEFDIYEKIMELLNTIPTSIQVFQRGGKKAYYIDLSPQIATLREIINDNFINGEFYSDYLISNFSEISEAISKYEQILYDDEVYPYLSYLASILNYGVVTTDLSSALASISDYL